ncbi:3-oxoacyl-ACP reductase FabG [Candidatus Blochmannia vicinus]|uniref:3-oxoacyl-[acyl-carrier-protein] reductase n=1 Tax=Candidatus Blochmannia vicinus (nom. nud.) TaxID=251540 RepID=A0A9Q8X1B4_9ENTR|nr:3-oxoacyl-ACP reductase FabG [Candidatus Blochmannia vicinus]URJ28355.1 3-oxoacyl-ACP reductase FabG [Candidatus Blochmannia vicinus]URJ30369.1 3-oxoacyl-ACP reductase FabG [Candidatus Blochmannia vicinus]URJ33068.1 3-oxoacyl-ACP reductase FabG [Candidatus Blochmannia vicinus]
MTFNEKIVLVTGARRGIGRAIIEMFAKYGATVIGTATSELGVKDIDMYLGSQGKGMELDVTDKYSIDLFAKKIRQEFGNVDILVNNAGIVQDNILLHMKDNEWKSVIDVNLTAVYRMSKLVIKSMIKKHYGRIINIGSVVGIMGNAGQVNYSAAKSGLIGFTKSLAREVASRGITVNLITPGFICTDMVKKFTDKQKNDILSKIPVNRFGEPKDVAYSVMFFASDYAEYITGQTMHVNGGMYMG